MDLVKQVLAHGTVRRLPVTEPKAIMVGVSTKVDDNAHEQKANKCDDYGILLSTGVIG